MTYKDTLLSDTFTVNMPTSEAYAMTLNWLHSKKVPLSKPEKGDQIIAYYTKPLPTSGEKVGLVRFNFTGLKEGTVVEVDFPIYPKISELEGDIVILTQDYLPEFFRIYRMHMGVEIDEKWLRKMYPEDRRRALTSMRKNSAFVIIGVGVLLLVVALSSMHGRIDSGVDFVDAFFIFISLVLFLSGLFTYWWYTRSQLSEKRAHQEFVRAWVNRVKDSNNRWAWHPE